MPEEVNYDAAFRRVEQWLEETIRRRAEGFPFEVIRQEVDLAKEARQLAGRSIFVVV
jgi:hypothetical protein